MARNDSVVQCSVNRKELATIALYMYEQDVKPRSISELLRTTIEVLSTILVERMGAQKIETLKDANAVLDSLFVTTLNPSERLKKALLKNLQDEYENDELVFVSDKSPNIEKLLGERNNLTDKYMKVIKSESIKRGYIQADENGKEELAEQIKAGIALRDSTIEQEAITPLQKERFNKIVIIQKEKIEHYKQLADQVKTAKAKEQYEVKISQIIRLAERAKTDDEALRLLTDII